MTWRLTQSTIGLIRLPDILGIIGMILWPVVLGGGVLCNSFLVIVIIIFFIMALYRSGMHNIRLICMREL